MKKIPTTTMIDENDEHHMYTQMIDPNHANLSVMTHSNDSTKDPHMTTKNNETRVSGDNNIGSLSSSSIIVPTPSTSSKVASRKASNRTNSHSNAATKYTTNDATEMNDDTESIASRVSFGSSTDGIDILRGNIGTPTNFIDWSHLIAARVVSSVLYKRTILFCILLSSLLLAIRTVDHIRESAQMIRNIEVVLHFLLILFTIEVLLAIACFRELVVSTGWLCSDVVIICIVWYSNDSTFLILRAFRLIRALRKASSVPSLQWAVRSILHVLPRLTAVIVVLVPSMIAIFAILFTNLYQDADMLLSDAYIDDQQYGTVSRLFYRLDVSALTLFQIMTGGRNWADISTTLMSDNTYPLAWIPLVGYVIVSTFVAATLVIALMCDAVTTVKQNQMLKVFEHSNVNHSTTKSSRRSKRKSDVSQSPDFVEVGWAPKNNLSESHQLYHRLEQKINELNNSVEMLLRMQMGLQESIDRCSLQHHKTNDGDAHPSNTVQAPLSPRQQQFQQQQLQFQNSIRNNNTASANSYGTALMVPRLSSVPSDEH